MKILDTEHKRKSAIITSTLLFILLFLMFNYGMSYFDPPTEYGVAINFGNSDVGSGDPVENVKETSQVKDVTDNEEQMSEEEVSSSSESTNEENVVTNEDASEAPVIKKTEEDKEVEPKKDSPTNKTNEKKSESKPKTNKPASKPNKPSKSTSDALSSLLKGNSKTGLTKGEGDDSKSGVKGNSKGDPKSSKYYGNGGNGSRGNYRLSGRTALARPKQKPNCQEEGFVVVTIHVNQAGKVVEAYPGTKGTTNSAPCLKKAAKKAALKTKWNKDSKAPTSQKGAIVYHFKLSQ